MAITDKVKDKREGVTEELIESVESLKGEVKHLKEKVMNRLPIKHSRPSIPVQHDASRSLEEPFHTLQFRRNRFVDDFNRMFEDFFRDFERWGKTLLPRSVDQPDFFEGSWPRIDLSETATEVIIKAEFPGVDKNDIDVSLTGESLTIRGEKKSEHEDKGRDYHRIECLQGSFTRRIPLPASVDTDKAEASFKKHVLIVTIPKSAQETGKRIEITAG